MTKMKRPMLWIPAAIALGCYWDPKALRGPFVYDDVASIINNDVVMGNVPWHEAFQRDFWGQLMIHPASHKSYRPITSLTLRLNMMVSMMDGTAGTEDHTYYFHLVNVLLHGINSGLIAETSAIVFGDDCIAASMISGILFAIHPVHAEAVSNITSRGELLMTLFFLLAFLSYAHHIPSPESLLATPTTSNTNQTNNQQDDTQSTKKDGEKSENPERIETKVSESSLSMRRSLLCVYILPCLLMALSLFSKEQGVTTLCTLVAYDFIRNHSSIKSFLSKLQQGDRYSWDFFKRAMILGIQTVLLAGLRYWLNGESSPDFVEEQNPAGFSKDQFTRVFSVNWVYCLYLRDMVLPLYLAPDWSGHGIPLIETISDNRIWLVLLLWLVAFVCVLSLVMGPSAKASKQWREIREEILIALFAFLFLPFLLSSNLLVTTGLAKGDRVIYLPLFGYCLIQGLLFKVASCKKTSENPLLTMMYTFLTIQLAFFGLKVHERNLAWADEYTLWTRAYHVNPKSFHTISHAGRMLAKNKEYEEAEKVLRPIGDVRKNGGNPNDTFLYAVSLSKLDRCEEAFRLIEDAIEYIFEEREAGGLRYDPKMSFHSQSSLMIARAFCTDDIIEKGRIMEQAVHLDPNNEFAKVQFQNYLEKLQRMQEMQRQMQMQQMGAPRNQEQMVAMLQQQLQVRVQMLQQQQGKPVSQEQIMMIQQQIMQEFIGQQEGKSVKQQHHGNPQTPAGMSPKRELKEIPQNLNKHAQNQGMSPGSGLPPIDNYEDEEIESMFSNPDMPPETKKRSQSNGAHSKDEPAKDKQEPETVGMPPPKQGVPPNLGLPPIHEFENGEFEKFLLH